MRDVTVATTQMACDWDRDRNVARAEALVREAAARGASIIQLQELFESPYFPKDQSARYFALAQPIEGHPLVARMSRLAAELRVVLPISFFERANNAYFNSMAMIDADGKVLGLYRKGHIPDGPGYQEKYYFNPGDTGFRTWQTKFGCIGVGICWDQWFPEAARVMVLMGAELLLYPTAIGSEPQAPTYSSRTHWQRVMQGHAGANMVPVIAANRVGVEHGDSCSLEFYGSSFITDGTGEIIEQAPTSGDAVRTASFDLDALAQARAAWGIFRDRRPDLYVPILSVDGQDPSL